MDPANPAATVSNFGIWSTKLTAGATPAVVISKPGVWDYSPLDDQD